MPAVSKAQQRFMGMVHATQKGDMEAPSKEVEKAADSMSKKSAKDFASTKHKGLPDKKDEGMCAECGDAATAKAYASTKHDGEPDRIAQMKEIIRQIMRERMIDEMNTTGNADGYQTPYAFGKKGNEKAKGKKQASLTGYTVVNESESTKVPYIKLSSIAPNIKVAGKENEKKAADVSGMEVTPKPVDKTVADKTKKTKNDTATKVGMELMKQNTTQAEEKSPKANTKGDASKDKKNYRIDSKEILLRLGNPSKSFKISQIEMNKDFTINKFIDTKFFKHWQLRLFYEDDLQRALVEDGQRTSLFISPKTYFGDGL